MDNLVAIDTSSIIWNMDNFNNNRHNYYQLALGINDFLEKIQKVSVQILLRKKLQSEIIKGIPFSELPNDYYYVTQTFYAFFDKMSRNLLNFEANDSQNITSDPNQVKDYFNQNTKNEVGYLLSRMHLSEDNVTYFTFEFLWDNNSNLKTEVNGEVKEHQTIISDKNNGLQEFINNITPSFEHNPKHDKTSYNSRAQWFSLSNAKKRNFVSPLSCYNGNDNNEPQRLLSKRYPKLIDNCFYSYDEVNEVFVVFRRTRNNIFHAYDEFDINKIPNKIKEHFNIWKYQ